MIRLLLMPICWRGSRSYLQRCADPQPLPLPQSCHWAGLDTDLHSLCCRSGWLPWLQTMRKASYWVRSHSFRILLFFFGGGMGTSVQGGLHKQTPNWNLYHTTSVEEGRYSLHRWILGGGEEECHIESASPSLLPPPIVLLQDYQISLHYQQCCSPSLPLATAQTEPASLLGTPTIATAGVALI